MINPFRYFSVLNCVFLLLGVAIGVLLSIFAFANRLSLSPTVALQVDPLGVVTLLVTVLLAVYVLRKLNKKDEGDKVEREILVRNFTDFENNLTNIIKGLLIQSQKGVSVTNVAAVLKRNRTRAQALILLASEQKLLPPDCPHSKNLMVTIKKIQDLMTSTPKVGAIEDGIRVKDGKLFYSTNHIDQIADGVFKMNNNIFRLIVEITRTER